jgi:large subunit ribosomal protein L13
LTPAFAISYDGVFRVFEIERRSLSMRTEVPSVRQINRAWHVIDAENAVLGRVASKVAMILMGKHKPIYAPNVDTGDHVIVVNAEKIKLTGGKEGQKLYRRHTGYPGGLIETGASKLRATRPTRMLELAVAGMLPKNKLGKQMYRKLNVYAGEHHPHQAQQPVVLDLGKEARR